MGCRLIVTTSAAEDLGVQIVSPSKLSPIRLLGCRSCARANGDVDNPFVVELIECCRPCARASGDAERLEASFLRRADAFGHYGLDLGQDAPATGKRLEAPFTVCGGKALFLG